MDFGQMHYGEKPWGEACMMSPGQVCLEGLNRAGVGGAKLLCRNMPKKAKDKHTLMDGPKVSDLITEDRADATIRIRWEFARGVEHTWKYPQL